MAIFSDCSVVLDLKNVPFKEKKQLMTALMDNGGNISYVVNQKCSFVVASSLEKLSSSRLRSAKKHQIPVVGVQYVWSCLEKGLLLPVQKHVLKQQSSDIPPEHDAGLKSREQRQSPNGSLHDENIGMGMKDGTYLGRFRLYKENDHDIPEFSSAFQVAKYSILFKPNTWSVLELQSAKGQAGQQYRVLSSIMHEDEKHVLWDKQVHCCSSEDAVEAYLVLSKELQVQGFTLTQTLPPWAVNLTSHSLQQLLLEEKLNCSTISQEVGVFVELIWTEALGSLSSILTVPVTSISLNDVSRVEGLLLQVQKTQCEDEVKGLLEEINTLLPIRRKEPDSKNKLVSQKLDLCQLIRDILNMTEATLGNPCPSSLGKYRALRCSIEQVPPESSEFSSVCQLLQDKPAHIQQILRVSRGTELHIFNTELGSIKPLLHSTGSSSLVGILSRGLLLPRVGVEKHGIERTDIGNLGSGIYFSDSLNTSVKYSKPSERNGCRLLLVCEVALGQCKDLHKRDFTLTSAPEGYHSVHGVRNTQNIHSDFEDDEYVVYNTDQIRLKYVVQYILIHEEVKDFQPYVDTTLAPLPMASSSHLLLSDDGEGLEVTKNSLEEVTAGLLDSNGQTLPLQAVHVRCKLMDLLSQVVIFQTYTNNSPVPIEAKYVFPLEETAAVCGFEAFINGKHVIGQVKEKEQARKEYKQAIEKGHGAYLMDQDAPDVFTISVGNLPPGATVLIKVTFITELVVRAGDIVFSLPGSVAPWQQSSALNQRTQTTVEKVRVHELQPKGEFSLCMSIEMPYEIMNLDCSHQIKIKRTDCIAVVRTLPDQTLSTDGFRLSFTLFQIHMPRMWVEKHPEKDTQACMLVFYPHFESGGFSLSGVRDVIIVLDTSESMRGDAMLNARRIALKVLNSLDRSLRVNIISFGSEYKEAFPAPNLLGEVLDEAKNFIMSSTAVGGSTELWRPLRTLNLLPPSHGVRNVLLISDGHVHNQPQTLQLVRDNVRHTRFFTCGLSVTANRYMLRALAQAGGGTYEFFDTKTKYAWAEKVNSLVKCMVSPGCSSVAVKWQQFNPTAPSPVQAPSQLHALFSDCHTLVYGFVPHCTQATLFADLSGQEIKTMVSTTELQKSKGTFLHKLTARAIIRDYEDGSLGSSEAEHEGKKAELKSYIIELSKEFSILSQFTSFVAVEERDQERPDPSFTDVPKIIAEEDVDILSYMDWMEHKRDIQGSDADDDYESHLEDYVEDCALYSGTDMACFEEGFDVQEYKESNMEMSNLSYLTEDDESFDDYYIPPQPDTVLTKSSRREPIEADSSTEYFSLPQRKAALKRSYVPPVCVSLSVSTEENEAVPCSAASLDVVDIAPASANIDLPLLSGRFTPATPDITDINFQSAAYVQSAASFASPPETLLGLRRSQAPPSNSLLRVMASPQKRLDKDLESASRNVVCHSLKAGFNLSRPLSFRKAHSSPRDSALNLSIPGTACPPFRIASMLQSRAHDLSLPSTVSYDLEAPVPPPASDDCYGSVVPAPPRPPSVISYRTPAAVPPPAFDACYGFGVPAPAPPPSVISYRTPAAVPPPAFDACYGSGVPAPAPPPPPPSVISYRTTAAVRSPAFDACYGSRVPAPAPPPSVISFRAPATIPLPTYGFRFGTGASAAPPLFSGSCVSAAPASSPAPEASDGVVDPGPMTSVGFEFGTRAHARGPSVRRTCIEREVKETSETQRGRKFKTQTIDQIKLYKQRARINWKELFDLQHQDGYWECTETLSRFLGLDVDFFANVFLKEKGICSLGATAHAVILKLVATLLVLQLIRVKKMAHAELLQSLFRLTEQPTPRPACWDALKKAVEWVCWADRQYPCVYSRLEFGCNWESCTRQLLGLDSLPPCSPLIPVLQRSTVIYMHGMVI